MTPACLKLKHGLIVSCQAREGDPFRDPESIARFARAVVAGGAVAIRADSPENIRTIRAAVNVPILGIHKTQASDGRILITPTMEGVRAIVEAGADFVALDCTVRGQRCGALERIVRIRRELHVPVMADVATLPEAVAAAAAGADFILSTMRGHTPETEHARTFQPSFIQELCGVLPVPVIAEGLIHTPEMAVEAIRAGAFAVVVGKAITRPQSITERFVAALELLAEDASS